MGAETDADLGRSARKRVAILAAARDLFLQRGYGGTSMDDVAARAAVSKQTVYKNFADKQRLFTEVITSDVGRTEDTAQAQMAAMPDSENVSDDLRAVARHHLADVMQPNRLRLRRMLIGEAERFPELAQAWYASGPERSCLEFARWFTAWDRRALLRAPDPMLAAQHFNWLVLSIPLNKAMAYAEEDSLFTEAELNHYADEAVRVFLAAYGRLNERSIGATDGGQRWTGPE
jgi:TetR/AcrR family transcriptional regulator, mexJK operon transcriptional repressor